MCEDEMYATKSNAIVPSSIVSWHLDEQFDSIEQKKARMRWEVQRI
jgi:hypothetical protein